ncbi:MAG: prephenate dehydrogenase [Caldisericia bacterium]
MFYSIFIVGLGLIGGSIGLALKDKWIRFGYDIDKNVEKRAYIRGVVDEVIDLEEGLKKDLILISIPVQFIPEFLEKNKNKIGSLSIVIDTGSTKREVIKKMNKLNCYYIGGHPIAGKEKSGIDNIDKELFKNKIFVLTKENNLDDEKLRIVLKMIKDIESKEVFLSIDEHDYFFSLLSHFPYILSLSLFNFIYKNEGNRILKYSGSGLKDMTRIASGDPIMSYGFLITNLDNIKKVAHSFIDFFIDFLEKIENDEFLELIKEIKKERDKIW